MLITEIFDKQIEPLDTENYNLLLRTFRKDTNITHKDVLFLSKKLGLSVHDMQLKIYDVLGDLLRNVGKHNDVPDDQFDQKELSSGIKEEMEHTKDPLIAKMIAKDHLVEDPKYYSKLKKAKLADS